MSSGIHLEDTHRGQRLRRINEDIISFLQNAYCARILIESTRSSPEGGEGGEREGVVWCGVVVSGGVALPAEATRG